VGAFLSGAEARAVDDEYITFVVSKMKHYSAVQKWIGLFASLTREQRRREMASLRASGVPVSFRKREGPPEVNAPLKEEVLKKLRKRKKRRKAK